MSTRWRLVIVGLGLQGCSGCFPVDDGQQLAEVATPPSPVSKAPDGNDATTKMISGDINFVRSKKAILTSEDGRPMAVQPPPTADPTRGLEPYVVPIPYYMAAPLIPRDNPLTHAGVDLGRQLFYDPLLSGGDQLSCVQAATISSTHLPMPGASARERVENHFLGTRWRF